jgi:hypothetical protein
LAMSNLVSRSSNRLSRATSASIASRVYSPIRPSYS